MTTATMTTTATREAAPQRGTLSRLWNYFSFSLGSMVRDWSFLAFIIAMPVTMYLFFAGIYGGDMTEHGPEIAAGMMISMATYGGLGAAMNAGSTIQAERSSGWFRNLMLTPLTPGEFIAAKVLTAVCAMVPALGAVFVAGMIRGVRMDVGTWFTVLGLLLVALLPMVLLGLVIGLWFKQQTAGAVTTLTMLALSMIGGLFVPLDLMPQFMQTIGKAVPSYWAGQIGLWPLAGGDFPWEGAMVIGIWAVVLLIIGALGYRRAIRTSRR